MRRLGATKVFDYRSLSVVADIIAVLRGRTGAGAIAIGGGSALLCIDVLGACKGNRFVAVATPAASFDEVPAGKGHRRALVATIARVAIGNLSPMISARRNKVITKMI